MKIKETLERECCQHKDLKPVVGPGQVFLGRDPKWKFCTHCGRYHKVVSFTDPAGASDWEYRPQPYPWTIHPEVKEKS